MISAKKLLYEICLKLKTLEVVVDDGGAFSETVAGNSYADITHNYTKSGYYPLGIVGVTLTGTNATFLSMSRFFLSSQSNGACTVTLRVRNATASDSTPNVNVYILWKKI